MVRMFALFNKDLAATTAKRDDLGLLAQPRMLSQACELRAHSLVRSLRCALG